MNIVRNRWVKQLAAALMVLGLAMSLGLSHALEAAFTHCDDHCETQCEQECDLDCACLNCVHSKLTVDVIQQDMLVASDSFYSATLESAGLPEDAWIDGIDHPPQVIL